MAIDLGNRPVLTPPTAAQSQQIGNALGMITSNVEIAGGGTKINNMVAITQEDYNTIDELGNLDVNTLYLIVG